MEVSSPYKKPHFSHPPDPNPSLQQQHQTMKNQPKIGKSKSCSYFLFKALFFSMFLVLVPLFPSQAPDFINQSIITKLWELIHLLFIGIAVSYGLFCRRNVDDQVSFDSTVHSKFDNLHHDMCRMFHFSSISEDGYGGNSCFDAQFHLGQSRIDLSSSVRGNGVENSCGFGEQSDFQDGLFNPNFLVSGNGAGNLRGYGDKNGVLEGNFDPNFLASENGFGKYGEKCGVQDGNFNPNFLVSGNGVENSCGYGEKGVQDGNFNPKFLASGNGFGNSCGHGEKGGVQDGKFNPNFLGSGNGFGNSCGHGKESVVQAWNAQYFQGESMVVVAEPNCSVGEWGEPGSVVDYKPLGLPVRSLRSRIRKGESGEVLSGNDEAGFGSVDSYESCDVVSRNEKFGDLGPWNLEEKFDEAVIASPSPIPWHSRSGRRREVREKPSAANCPSSHFRPLSVDEAQFELMRTPSLRSTVSFSSNASSMSSSQGDDSPSHSVASEVMSLKMEDKGKETSSQGSSSASSGSTSPARRMKPDVRKAKSFQGGSSASSSPSLPKPVNDKVLTGILHTRGHSFTSLYEHNLRGAKDYLKDVIESKGEDLLDRKESGPSTLNLEKKPKPASLKKASLRGKSVRTIRASRQTTIEAKSCEEKKGNLIDHEDVKATLSRNEEVDLLVNGSSKQNYDTLPEYQKREMQKISENVSARCEEHIKSEGEKIRLSSGEEADNKYAGDATPEYASEVDKKAGEFIAKFREQIRLQKVASMERSRGLRFGGNHFR